MRLLKAFRRNYTMFCYRKPLHDWKLQQELTKTKQLYLFCLFARDRTELIQCEVGFLPSCYLPVLLNERDFFWLSSECF